MKRKIIDPDALRALAAEGKTIPEIAELLDFSKSGVRHCCELHGIRPTLAQHGRKAGFKVKPVAPVAKKVCVTVNRKLTDETAAYEAKAMDEIKQATHTEARPCECRKPTPVEALQNRIKLPWTGKVQQQTPADLAPDLYDELLEYGAGGIAEMFGFTPDGFEVWLKKYGYAPAVFRAHDYADDKPIPYVLTDPDGLNYQDRHFLGLDKPHAPTADELTEMFEPEPPGGILQTAELLADLVKQREHLRDEERLVAGLRAKVDRDIAECLQVIREAAR